jgi:hypothetical protein
VGVIVDNHVHGMLEVCIMVVMRLISLKVLLIIISMCGLGTLCLWVVRI